MRDLNARVESSESGNVVGKYDELILNNYGQKLVGLCEECKQKYDIFEHRSIHKYNWHQDTRILKSIVNNIKKSTVAHYAAVTTNNISQEHNVEQEITLNNFTNRVQYHSFKVDGIKNSTMNTQHQQPQFFINT